MSKIEEMMEVLRDMGKPQRKAFIATFEKEFCIDCAKNDPHCQCWMDE